MKKLAYETMKICQRNRDGSYSTQASRSRMLSLCMDQLDELGFKTNKMTVSDLKGRHINALVKRWHSENLSASTMKNRLAGLRWLAEKIGNKGLVKSNDFYKIPDRVFVTNEDKAVTLDQANKNALSAHVLLSLEMQQAFGLRREESMKFSLDYALAGHPIDKANMIRIKPSWSKGGRYREIPITNDNQRLALHKVRALVGDQSLIPSDKSYKQHLKTFESETAQAGIGKTHGLRHQYAQNRYRELLGYDCPAVAGNTNKPSDLKAEKAVRMQISQELGHNRLQVTSIYLGSWQK